MALDEHQINHTTSGPSFHEVDFKIQIVNTHHSKIVIEKVDVQKTIGRQLKRSIFVDCQSKWPKHLQQEKVQNMRLFYRGKELADSEPLIKHNF